MTNTEIVVRFSKPEALVLFEWLATLDSEPIPLFKHPSEERVVRKMEGQLESKLAEPLAPDYAELVADARRIVDRERSDF
jgi:hypothetical protein